MKQQLREKVDLVSSRIKDVLEPFRCKDHCSKIFKKIGRLKLELNGRKPRSSEIMSKRLRVQISPITDNT